MKVYTIGFTKSSAQSFFTRLQKAGARTVVDVRLNNVSQLAGFTKKDDLRYFLSAIGGIGYAHEVALAPTQELLDEYKKRGGSWSEYEKRFLALMAARSIETKFQRSDFDRACFLCSEDKPHHCHRRLVAEYLKEKWGELEIVHL
jgi:uncharacterized protein (DUF488 family)